MERWLAGNFDHFIEMPLVAKGADPGSDFFGGLLAKLHRPGTYRFVCDLNAAYDLHFFDHAQTQCKTKVQPNRIADYLRRETIASIRNRIYEGVFGHAQMFAALTSGLT